MVPPDLIIEIISLSSIYYEIIEKRELYEKFGVREYWIVEPKKQFIEVYINSGRKFMLAQRVENNGKVKSTILPDFIIQLEDIF